MTNPLGNLTRRIQNLFQVGRSTTTPTDTGSVQVVQLKTPGQVRDGVPVVYQYGFSAVLPVGSDCIILNVTGDSSNGCVVATGHQASRPVGMTADQVQLYTVGGDQILLTSGAGISITPSGGTVKVNGAMVITGDCTIGGRSFLKHVHSGVSTGSGDTGAPV